MGEKQAIALMDYALLRAEILTDPTQRGYAGKSHNEIASILNAKERSLVQPLSSADAMGFMAKHNLFQKIDQVSNLDAKYSNVQSVKKSLDLGSIRLNNAGVQAVLQSLVQSKFITADQLKELMDLATVKVSRAAEIGLEEVSAAYVAEALGG